MKRFFLIFALLLPALAAAQIRVTSGTTPITDSQANVWTPVGSACSTYLVNGTPGGPFSTTSAIAKALPAASDQALYQTELAQVDTCTFSVQNGNYTLTGKFAEIAGNTTRNFSVSVNGAVWLTNFSPYAAAGNQLFTAVDKTLPITVTTGTVSIVFSSAYVHVCTGCSGNAIFEALSIQPPTPSGITLTVNGTTPFSTSGTVPFSSSVPLANCTSAMNASGVALSCPPVTGNVPWSSTGMAPYSIALTINGLPAGCTATISGTVISVSGCTAIVQHNVNLSWVASNTCIQTNPTAIIPCTASGFTAYRGTQSGGPYVKLANTTAPVYTDQNVPVHGILYYVVTAYLPPCTATQTTLCGESNYSNEASALIP